MDESADRRWKVGELAKVAGTTVRALHHYDDVGLLVPWERTAAGHRLYALRTFGGSTRSWRCDAWGSDWRRSRRCSTRTPARIPYTPEAQKAIQLAHREETTCRPNRLGTEHILLGLVRADEEALAKFGVTADRVREEVQALSASPADESPSEETPPAVA